jgi:hypothetical protein
MGRYFQELGQPVSVKAYGLFLFVLMPTPFDNLSLQTAREYISVPPYLEDNRLYYTGDHWAQGRFWVGPRSSGTDSAVVLSEIQRGFVSSNKVREAVERHVGGVIGREPAWGLTVNRPLQVDEEPTTEEKALIKEAEALLTGWWDERRIHALIRKATATLLWGSRSCVRLFVPVGTLKNGIAPFVEPEQAINLIYAQRPDPTQSVVYVDPDTQQRIGIYAYEYNYTHPLYQSEYKDWIEVSYLDGEKTVLQLLNTEKVADETRLVMGGHLWLYEMCRDVMITPQVRQLQNLLNMALTMMQRNVILGGFLERVLLNVQLPGSYVDDVNEPTGKRFVPQQPHVGASTLNAYTGLSVTDAAGNVSYTNPSVIYRDPVPVDVFEQTKNAAYLAILEETQQLHAAIAGDATASGKSRQQAMADFLTSLLETAAEVNALGRWLLETVLSLTALYSGQQGRYDSLRATFDCRLDLGPLDPQDVQQVINLVNNKLLSHETGMARVRVDDVDAEQTRINAEAEVEQQRQIQMIQMNQLLHPPTAGQPPQTNTQQPAQGADQQRKVAADA